MVLYLQFLYIKKYNLIVKKRTKRKEREILIKIKELPELERPYEKLEMYGEKSLSDAELLAIIIKTGNREETSVQIAQKLLSLNETTEENLNYIQTLSLEELMEIKGIGKVKAIQLKAVGEIAIRMFSKTNYKKIVINSPSDLAKIFINNSKFEKEEMAKIVILNTRNEVLKIKNISKGGINFVNVMVKDILVEPIKMKAPKYILVHNHPGGSVKPSEADIECTKKLFKLSELFGIELLDHIIISGSNYTSIIQNWLDSDELENYDII